MIQKEDFEQLDTLLEEEPHLLNSLRAGGKSYKNVTLLMSLVKDLSTNKNAFEHFLSYEQDISIVDDEGNNFLHHITKSSTLMTDEQTLETLKIVYKHRCDISDLIGKQNVNGHTPLHEAALSNKKQSMQHLFDDGGNQYQRS